MQYKSVNESIRSVKKERDREKMKKAKSKKTAATLILPKPLKNRSHSTKKVKNQLSYREYWRKVWQANKW